MSVARYRERHSTSGAKSDAADAHLLAEIVRLDRAHHRPVAGDSQDAEAIKLVARTHQSLIWDRTRHMLRLRSALRDLLPAAPEAFADLDAPDALELLAKAPDPTQARREPRPDHRGTEAVPATRRRRQGRANPPDPARRAAAQVHRSGGGLRRDRDRTGRDPADPEHPDQGARDGGGGPFWPAPGR